MRYVAPPELKSMISDLITRDNVRSVSCTLADADVWKMLVGEQLRRTKASGLPRQMAFCLTGPDDGLSHLPEDCWGGEIHIPYEGCCDGDLFFHPGWRLFHADSAREAGKLNWATTKQCHYAFVSKDYGDIGCATRQVVGDWVLYSSTGTYVPADPLGLYDYETRNSLQRDG